MAVPAEPDLSGPLKAAVERAVRWAWRETLARWPDVACQGREEEITECLQRVLNEHGSNGRRAVPGLGSFETIARGAKVTTADGRVEKAPDLVFRPIVADGVRNRSDWGMFVECKIIAPESHHSPDAYCANGVARFAKGEYAACMRSGVLIAYVRDGRLPHPTLTPLLDATYATLAHDQGQAPDVSASRHARRAVTPRCVDITLTHLWLHVEGATAPRP